jgi:hypothetical protein
MGQFFTDDIDALLKDGFGDRERLTRIKSDFEAKKLVTIEDRRYVEGLVSRYLQPSIPESERIVKIPEKRIVPPPAPVQNISFEMKYQKPRTEQVIPKIGEKKKIRILVASIAAVVASLLIISVVINQENIISIEPPVNKGIEVDQTSYVRGDIISISGKTPSATTVVLVITNPSNQQIWTETLSTKQTGEFSTLTIAGGNGWEQAGRYTLSSTHDGAVEQATFNFNPDESS